MNVVPGQGVDFVSGGANTGAGVMLYLAAALMI